MVSFVCFVNIFTLIALTVSRKKTKVSFKKKEKVEIKMDLPLPKTQAIKFKNIFSM